jgi:hypothetical protein
MDTTRWKSILVPRELYLEVKETAEREGRTISGQLCYIYEKHKGRPLKKAPPPRPYTRMVEDEN